MSHPGPPSIMLGPPGKISRLLGEMLGSLGNMLRPGINPGPPANMLGPGWACWSYCPGSSPWQAVNSQIASAVTILYISSTPHPWPTPHLSPPRGYPIPHPRYQTSQSSPHLRYHQCPESLTQVC